MRSKALTIALSALLVCGTTAAGIAGKGGASHASSASAQYPGHGVGNTHQCPPSSPRGKAGLPGPPCGVAGGNDKGSGSSGGGSNNNCHGNSCNAPGHNKNTSPPPPPPSNNKGNGNKCPGNSCNAPGHHH